MIILTALSFIILNPVELVVIVGELLLWGITLKLIQYKLVG
jgi:hypothetical protein